MSNYNYNDNDDNNSEFQFPPEWEEVALSKNPLRMANTLYDNLKKQKHSGIIPHPDTIKYIIRMLKDILYRDFEWSVEQIFELENKFKELNKYYPTSQPPGTKEVILQNIPMLDSFLQKNKSSNIHFGLISVPVDKWNNIISEKKENNIEKKKNNKWKIIKNIVEIAFKVAIYWLALIGIFTLLGV